MSESQLKQMDEYFRPSVKVVIDYTEVYNLLRSLLEIKDSSSEALEITSYFVLLAFTQYSKCMEAIISKYIFSIDYYLKEQTGNYEKSLLIQETISNEIIRIIKEHIPSYKEIPCSIEEYILDIKVKSNLTFILSVSSNLLKREK